MKRLEELSFNEEAAQVKELAHKIKGAAANVRALRMRDLAKALEDAGAEGDPERIKDMAGALRGVWEETLQAMQRELESGSNA